MRAEGDTGQKTSMENRSGVTLLAIKVSAKARQHDKHQDMAERMTRTSDK